MTTTTTVAKGFHTNKSAVAAVAAMIPMITEPRLNKTKTGLKETLG